MEEHRKRLRRRETRSVRYLTFSCHKHLPLLGSPEWRDAFVQSLGSARKRCGFSLLAWVVMPEHVHLIVVPDDDGWPVPRILRALKQPLAQSALGRWRRTNDSILEQLRVGAGKHRYWQAGGGFDRNVRDPDELARAVDYIHQNPVCRELVKTPTEWAWSSARWYEGIHEGQIPIDQARW